MNRTHITAFASMLLALTWIMFSSGAGGQERSDRRDSSQPQYQSSQSQSQQDSRSQDSRSQSQQDSRSAQSQRPTSSDDEEIEYRGLEHAALGVMLGEQTGKGVRIRDVLRGGPADRAGLRSGDHIAKIDDKPMKSYSDVIRYINRVEPGQTSQITVNRSGDEKTLRVKFASREDLYGDQDQQWRSEQQGSGRNDFEQQDRYGRQSNWQDQGNTQGYDRQRGSEYSQSDRNWQGQGRQDYQRGDYQQSQARQGDYQRGNSQQSNWSNQDNSQPSWAREQQRNRGYQQLSSNQAVLGIDLENRGDALIVRSVWSGSPADQAGLRTGDEIVSIDDQDIQGQRDLIQTLRDYQPGDRVKLTVYRNGQERTLRARLASQRDVAMQAGGRFQGNSQFQDNSRFQQDNSRYQENTRYQDNNRYQDNSARSDRDNANYDRDNSSQRQQRQAQRDRSRYDQQYEER